MIRKAVFLFFIITTSAVSLIIAYIGYDVLKEDSQTQYDRVRYEVPIVKTKGIDTKEAPLQADEHQQNEAKSITIAAVGDIMVHIEQIVGAEVNRNGRKVYDFDPSFHEIAPYLQAADFVIGNLETTIAGEANRGYTGYPEFNAPEALLSALKRAGFDFLSTANNHSLDRREAGVIATIENIEKSGLLFSGTARSQKERDLQTVVERNGIKMAIFSYTYGTNGIPIPAGKDYLVNLIDKQRMQADIERVRDLVDYVLVCMHYGHEYHRQPNAEQIDVSDFLVESGADIVLGSHPHVLQPAVWREREQKSPAFIIYSLGNFISAQRMDYKDNGVVVYLTLSIDEQGKKLISNAEFLPTYVQKTWYEGKTLFRILAAEKSINDYENKKDPILREYDYNRLRKAFRDTKEHLTIDELENSSVSAFTIMKE